MKWGVTLTPPSTDLRRLAGRVDALRPPEAPPAWGELRGPLDDDPPHVTWHTDGPDSLIGFRAPSECEALAMVANGWGRGLGPASSGEVGVLEPGERRRIRVAVVVTRSGGRAGRLRIAGGPTVDEPPGGGRALDCLLRALGLPTAPPAVPTDSVVATIWLKNIEVAARGNRRLTWAGIASLHPAMAAIEQAGEPVPLDQLTTVLRVTSRVWSWSFLLDAAATGWLAELLPLGAGSWMDEGMLSRWLSDLWPAPDVVLPRVGRLIRPDLARRLHDILGELGVLGSSPG